MVSANSWMNAPRGFTIVHGRLTGVDPWEAMFNPATGPETTHMILAAFMVTGFGVASVYAVAMLRGRTDRYHRLGLAIPLTLGAAITPVQIGVGDWAARAVGSDQPLKLAAMEGLYHGGRGVPEAIGGYFANNRCTARSAYRTGSRCCCTSARTATSRAWTARRRTSGRRW